jgi:hypothetical protein
MHDARARARSNQPKAKSMIDPGWRPPIELAREILKAGFDVADMLENFIAFNTSKSVMSADWTAEFRMNYSRVKNDEKLSQRYAFEADYPLFAEDGTEITGVDRALESLGYAVTPEAAE